MEETDVLIVGPASRTTGGIARFLSEQRHRLAAEFVVRVYDSGTNADSKTLNPLETVGASIVAMIGFLFQPRPDIVHVHTSHGFAFYRASWYVLVAGGLWRRPVAVHIHGSSFDAFTKTESPLVVAVQRLTFSIVDRVIVLSEHWWEVLDSRVDDSKLFILPNAVDPEEYTPSYGGDPPVVTFVSNHIERKGIGEFVTAIERISDADVQVRIAGSGPLSFLSTELAEKCENVEYLGYISESEKRRILEATTVYVLPTYAEGLPIALLEGMAGGNAIITTNVGAIPEVVDENSGWIIPHGDTDALTDALRAFIDDPEVAVEMGRHNRSIVEDRYAWPVVIDRLSDLYRTMVDEETLSDVSIPPRQLTSRGLD